MSGVLAAIALFSASLGADEPSPVPSLDPAPSPSASVASEDPLAFDLALSTREPKDGSIVEISLKPSDTVDPGSFRISFEGVEFPVYGTDEGLGALVLVPFNSKPRETSIRIRWKEKKARRRSTEVPIRVVDGNYQSEVLTVQEDRVNPPKRVIKRLIKEQKEIGAIYRNSATPRKWKAAFAWPIESEITSPFGNKRIYNGSMKSFHQGLDLRARTPTPIKAPEAGIVALAKDLYFTGNTVILDHGKGLFTVYGHMSRLDVKKGQEVAKGTVLGLSGATGRASGPHLHWGAILMRQKFNPRDLVQALR